LFAELYIVTIRSFGSAGRRREKVFDAIPEKSDGGPAHVLNLGGIIDWELLRLPSVVIESHCIVLNDSIVHRYATFDTTIFKDTTQE
jgi:hypothetical protein